MCSIDDMEDFRSRMRAVTGLVVVGGADDLLRISPDKMLAESITQEIVDRCILVSIRFEFALQYICYKSSILYVCIFKIIIINWDY